MVQAIYALKGLFASAEDFQACDHAAQKSAGEEREAA
jgi:hypothetical protein